MSTVFEAKNDKLSFIILPGQEGYEEGLALAARFAKVDYKTKNNVSDFKRVKEIVDPENLVFTEGYRFTLLMPNRYQVYWTNDAYVYKGAQDFAEKILKIPKDTFVTDIIDFNAIDGGNQVFSTGEINREVVVNLSDKKYLLEYKKDKGVTVYYYNGNEYVSKASETLAFALQNREFLDNIREELGDEPYFFFTQALLTTMAGLPSEIAISVSEGNIKYTDGKVTKVIKSEDLSSGFFADYLSKVI